MAYAWHIHADYMDGDEIGTAGPHGVQPEALRQTIQEGRYFRMYDDDGTLYFEGRIIGEYDGFEPLDDFGMPSYGCTEIRYQNPKTSQFETL